VHNGPAEGREKEAWQWSGRATRRTCFRPRELTEDAKNTHKMVDSDDLKDTTIAQRLFIGVRETWALTATPDGNNQ
jgi:hypothetical protein